MSEHLPLETFTNINKKILFAKITAFRDQSLVCSLLSSVSNILWLWLHFTRTMKFFDAMMMSFEISLWFVVFFPQFPIYFGCDFILQEQWNFLMQWWCLQLKFKLSTYFDSAKCIKIGWQIWISAFADNECVHLTWRLITFNMEVYFDHDWFAFEFSFDT